MFKIALGFILILIFAVTVIVIKIYNLDELEYHDIYTKILFAVGGGSIGILWIWMISDFFKRNNLRRKVLWGWMLILLNWLAAIGYFLLVYFPNKRKKRGIKNNVVS